MAKLRYTKDSIIEILRNLSKQLNKTKLTTADVAKVIPESTVTNHFGSVGNALEAAGLERTALGENFRTRGNVISDEELFHSLLELEARLGHEPRFNENSARGKYSRNAFRKRFGKWNDVLAHYRKWKAENTETVNEVGSTQSPPPESPAVTKNPPSVPVKTHPAVNRKSPAQLYGEPMDFRGFRHQPINEQGVVYLFSMVSRELGFYIEAVQQGFPDCEGKYLHDEKKNLWAKARIEFEYRASNFRDHGHDSEQCDFIVCWINDWPECPINVIELRTELLKLPSQ